MYTYMCKHHKQFSIQLEYWRYSYLELFCMDIVTMPTYSSFQIFEAPKNIPWWTTPFLNSTKLKQKQCTLYSILWKKLFIPQKLFSVSWFPLMCITVVAGKRWHKHIQFHGHKCLHQYTVRRANFYLTVNWLSWNQHIGNDWRLLYPFRSTITLIN